MQSTNIFDISGKYAVVTGASSGLGKQFAVYLAEQGAHVAIVARRLERLNELKTEIESLGVRCVIAQCDVTKSDQITAAVEKIVGEFGRIDVLCNNAGLGLCDVAENTSDELWLTMMDTNVNGVFFFAREVGKIMLKQGYGKIINTASVHAEVAMRGFPLSCYAATKGAVRMITKSLAVEWAMSGITVNAIGPAYFESELTHNTVGDPDMLKVITDACPMGRIGREGELNGAIHYFASDASSYTTGQLLLVDGGWSAY